MSRGEGLALLALTRFPLTQPLPAGERGFEVGDAMASPAFLFGREVRLAGMDEMMLRGGARPRMVRGRPSTWTKAIAQQFIDVLSDTCNVGIAARSIGRSIGTVYRERKKDAAFRAAWDQAIVLPPDAAKGIAAAMLARRWGLGERMTLRLPPSRIRLGPGDMLDVPGRGRWQIQASEVDGLAVVIEARRAEAAVPMLTAEGGRSIGASDVAVTRTTLGLFEVPQADGRNLLHVAASSVGGFGAVPVELRVGGGLVASVAVTRKARLGSLATAMTADALTVDIVLVDAGQLLLNADAAAIAAGANRAMIGHEMLQFASAEALGGGAYRLGGLVRGVRGTGWAAGAHPVGGSFCLVDGAAMVPVAIDEAMAGETILATAFGLADAEPMPSASLTYVGQSMSVVPPAMVTSPTGGAVVDGEARVSIDAILAVLAAHGMTVA